MVRPRASARIAPPASDTVSASHLPATDAVFAAAGQAANEDDGWLLGTLSVRLIDAI